MINPVTDNSVHVSFGQAQRYLQSYGRAGATGTVGPVLAGPLLRSSPDHKFRYIKFNLV